MVNNVTDINKVNNYGGLENVVIFVCVFDIY